MDTVEAIHDLLKSATKLNEITFVTKQWSGRMLLCIAQKSAITTIHIGCEYGRIDKKCLEEIANLQSPQFQNLRKLNIKIARGALNSLVPLIGTVTDLTLGLEDLSFDSLAVLAELSGLKEVVIESYEESSVRATDLVHLAHHCHKLTRLEIRRPLHGIRMLTTNELTDSVLKDVVEHLPGLEIFCLPGRFPAATELSILHLGRKCEALRCLELSASVDFRKLAAGAQANLFPALDSIRLKRGSPYGERETVRLSYETFTELATTLAQAMPKCKRFESDIAYFNTSSCRWRSLDKAVWEVLGQPKGYRNYIESMSSDLGLEWPWPRFYS